MAGHSLIAAIANRDGRNFQALLASAAEDWRKAGMVVVGLVAEDRDVEGSCSAGFLRDLASGRRHSVHLDKPPAGETCQLDASGMDGACAGLLGQIDSADVVVISKFGKLEAMRKGLWPAFAAALAADKPLLTTVSSNHADAWSRFAPEASWLAPDISSVERWRQATTPRPPAVGPDAAQGPEAG